MEIMKIETRGRPPKPENELMIKKIVFNLTKNNYSKLVRRSVKANLSISEYIRSILFKNNKKKVNKRE